MEIKPIETIYNGYRFRSRLEARWAVFFDAAGIPYEYEPEGFELDGIKYLPDFYLPDQKTFFECKGRMDEESEKKIAMLAKASHKEIIIGYSGMTFQAAGWGPKWEEFENDWEKGQLYQDSAWLCECRKCGKLFFMSEGGSWACRCCGHYDGDAGFDVKCYGDDPTNEYTAFLPVQAARQARFEHGDTPEKTARKIQKQTEILRAYNIFK